MTDRSFVGGAATEGATVKVDVVRRSENEHALAAAWIKWEKILVRAVPIVDEQYREWN